MSSAGWLLELSAQASVLVVLAAGVAWLLRKASPVVRQALWLVVLARLCLPVPLSLPTGFLPEWVRPAPGSEL